jgi:hypothetical protein
MKIFSVDDVDKFFDRFQDPSHEVDQILEQLEEIFHQLQLHKFTDDIEEIKRAFVKRLIMKSYRLGKEHAYAATVDVIRKRDSL